MIAAEFWSGLVLGAGGSWLLFRAWRRSLTRGVRAPLEAADRIDFEQIQDVEEERDRLFNLSLDLLAIGDLNGNFLQVNPAWVRVLQWSRDDILDRSLLELIHPEDRPAAARSLEELREGKPVRDLELRTLCRDGSHRWIAWSSFPLTARRTVFTVARDFTERKQAERELQRYQRRLQLLAQQLATVEERQQRRLAEILHDTLAQEIFAAQAKLSLLKQPERLDDPGAVLHEVATILDHANALTRSLTFELFPPALYEVGLDAALEWLCRSFHRTRGLLCTFECVGESIDLPQNQRTLMYQGARELLGNVYKHAGAERADMRLLLDPWQIELRVDDDGCGFDPESPSADTGNDPLEDLDLGGFGLFNIRERLGPYGGELSIGTSPTGGARVTITLPMTDGEE
jgi:PAS domain S-box-containing protein